MLNTEVEEGFRKMDVGRPLETPDIEKKTADNIMPKTISARTVLFNSSLSALARPVPIE